MSNLSTAEVRRNLSDLINQAAYAGERTIIERHGKPVAALVSVEDLEALETLEDMMDVQEAMKRLREGDDGAVTLEAFERELERES